MVLAEVSNSLMSNFPQGQGNQGIARRRTFMYAAQEIPQIDAEIAEKGHLWMETSYLLTATVTKNKLMLVLSGYV